MCGICGFVNRNGQPANIDIVRRMNSALVHRGPDDSGEFVHGPVALGHRRLSIVDVARGRQPMELSGSPYCIVYNGEVYNHRELRKRLPVDGNTYRTTCDTETILAAFRQLGDKCLEQLQGMFALAIHDRRDDSLFLARDRMGIKPLYYYASDNLFAFASEIKALLVHPDIATRVNVSRLPVQLSLKYTLDDETLFDGIKKLPPGTMMRVSSRDIDQECYWDLSFTNKTRFTSIDDAADEFHGRFNESVRSRLMADVPLGVFLSGGLDSSVIAASMSKMVSEPIKSYSVAFAERDYSELEYSRAVARHIGAEIREVVVSPEQWFSAWPLMVYHEDEPIAHPSSIPLHFVSMLAAEDVKVVLTGEGSDELLAGYERYYQTLANLRYGKFVPPAVRSLAQRLIDLLPDKWMPKRKAVRTSLYLPTDIDSLFLDNYAAIPRAALAVALRPQFQQHVSDGVYSQFSHLMDISDAEELLDRILYADMKTYLVELLMKQDQMSMSASLESRVPFLDHRLVEFICRLPVEYKLRGFETKRILRHALGHTVPSQVVTRSKKGFPTPIKEWFRGEYCHVVEELLLSENSLSAEYIERGFVRQVLQRHQDGEWNLQEQIWTLANFELWLRIFIDGQSPDVALPRKQEALTCVSCG